VTEQLQLFNPVLITFVCFQKGIPVTDPKYYSTLSEQTLASIFKSDTATAMPLLKERLAALHEAGQVLVEVGDLNLK